MVTIGGRTVRFDVQGYTDAPERKAVALGHLKRLKAVGAFEPVTAHPTLPATTTIKDTDLEVDE